jgi:hypothetical protein
MTDIMTNYSDTKSHIMMNSVNNSYLKGKQV